MLWKAYLTIGFFILAAGAILAKNTGGVQGIIQTLPYIFIGIGSGIFGQNLGTVFNIYAIKKDPQRAKQKEIDEKDERNKAKAKEYNLMLIAFGALMLAFALMQVDLTVILSVVAVYLFVAFSNVYFVIKYNKEM